MILLCLLLSLSPIPFTPPGFDRLCVVLEIFAPDELPRRYFGPGEKLAFIRQAVHELRHAPGIRDAELLPDYETCRRCESFYDTAICQVEKQSDLVGSYRWEDFSPRLEALQERRAYWERCRIATNPHAWMADRRRALLWLRDH